METTMRLISMISGVFIVSRGRMSGQELTNFIVIFKKQVGISPYNIAILMNRMKNTISSHRSALAKKIIGAHARTKMLDDVTLRL